MNDERSRSGLAARMTDTLAFPAACYGTAVMLALVEFAIDLAYQPHGATVAPLWRAAATGLGDFVVMAAAMWLLFALVALGLRRLDRLVRRDRIVAAGLGGVLAYLGLAAMANLESRLTRLPSMSDTMLLALTLAVPTVLSAVVAPVIVTTLAARRDRDRERRRQR